jgi:hypothetical protein
MAKREAFKDIELAGRKWRIGKMDPLTGSYLATKLMAKVGHVAVGIASGNVTDQVVMAMAIAQEIGSFSKAEFLEIQMDCLVVCKEIQQQQGIDFPLQIIMPDGKWGVQDLEDDVVTVLALVTHTVIFNLTPFFDKDRLQEVKDSFKGLKLFDVPLSTSTPMPL